VAISFVIFDAVSMKAAFSTIGCLFGAGGLPAVSSEAVYYLKSYGLILLFSVTGATPVPSVLVKKLRNCRIGSWLFGIGEPLVLGILFMFMTAYLVDGSFNPFLYFRF